MRKLLVLVPLLLVAACGGSTKTITETVTVTDSRAVAPAETTETESEDSRAPGVGATQTIAEDGSQNAPAGSEQEVKLLAVKRLPRKRCDADGINCVTAKSGRKAIGIKLRVKGLDYAVDECAGNSASIVFDSGELSESVSYDPYQTPQLDCFKRRKGQAAVGWTTVQVPANETSGYVSWRPSNGNTSEDIQWQVKLP